MKKFIFIFILSCLGGCAGINPDARINFKFVQNAQTGRMAIADTAKIQLRTDKPQLLKVAGEMVINIAKATQIDSMNAHKVTAVDRSTVTVTVSESAQYGKENSRAERAREIRSNLKRYENKAAARKSRGTKVTNFEK